VRKTAAVGLIAIAWLSLTSGCAMSPEKREAMLMRAAIAGAGRCWTAPAIGIPKANAKPIPCPPGVPAGSVVSVDNGDLTVYAEAESAPPPPPLMAQGSASQLSSSEPEQGEQVLTVPASASQPPPSTSSPTSAPTPALPPPSPRRTPVAPVALPQAQKLASAQPAPPVPAPPEEKVILEGVFFDRNSSDLGPADELILDLSVDTLKHHPKTRIYVKGYSDSRGKPEHNQFLSQERAANVAAYLQSQGVPLSQLIVVAMGSTDPIASNATAKGRAKNRRVELEPVPDQP
jgi:outer membrane protein OmpA-like peptidoglycan-associated protein